MQRIWINSRVLLGVYPAIWKGYINYASILCGFFILMKTGGLLSSCGYPKSKFQENLMIQSSENIGRYVLKVRKELNVTQKDLALTAGTGLRFIIDLENEKS